jgi:UDP-N-acetylmuramoylalanine--D-glutamate ligase
VKGADWYNDSIATSPERAIAALNSFDTPIVLLAGGRDKDLPWGEFAEVVKERVEHLILFGEAKKKIEGALRNVGALEGSFSIQLVETLSEAVEVATEVVGEGDVVLLSPGGTSFDQYVDFVERGDDFRALVEDLT